MASSKVNVHPDNEVLMSDEKSSFLMEAYPNGLGEKWVKDDRSISLGGETSESSFQKEGNRNQWERKIEYLLSMIGYCVGLGNVWRFPYICIRNGGGAFLIPFFICLFACGLPLYFMEVALGQFQARSVFHIWNICPLLKGLGIGSVFLNFICSWYYIMILDWTLIFLVNSFKNPLPWTLCGQSWNTPACVPPEGRVDKNTTLTGVGLLANASGLVGNATGIGGNATGLMANVSGLLGNASGLLINASESMMDAGNGYDLVKENISSKSSTEEFWTHNVLSLSSGMHDLGGLSLQLSVSLFIAWLLVFLCLWKSVVSVGKVVYVTAVLPYILITAMLIKGCTLPGAGDGLLFYITPDFGKLLEANTWLEACVQVFYSLGPAWGGLITMSSYNKFDNNCMRDSIILTLVCEGTSVFTGLATFSFLGHMSYTLDVPLSNFSTTGPGLAFVVYPEAISYLPLPNLWGVLFFVMLLSLGLDSQFVTIEVILTFIHDIRPRFMQRWNMAAKAFIHCFFFFAALIFCTRGGSYLLQLVDWYIGTLSVLSIAVLECLVVGHIYGTERFGRDIKLMIGRRPYAIFPFLWRYVTPALLVTLFVSTLMFYKPPVYEGYTYGPEGIAFGWVIALVSFVPIPVMAGLALYRAKGSFVQRLRSACYPSDDWVPAVVSLREQYLEDNKDHVVFPTPSSLSVHPSDLFEIGRCMDCFL